jgi:hypothetical protein
MGSSTEVSDAEHILGWIVRREVPEFTKRDLHQAVRRRFPKPAALDAPVAELIRRNMIRPKQMASEARAGRPASPAFEVNPGLTETKGAPTRGNCVDSVYVSPTQEY